MESKKQYDEKLKETLLSRVSDLVSDLTYYGRKDDEELNLESFNYLIENNIVTVDEIIEVFKTELYNTFEI